MAGKIPDPGWRVSRLSEDPPAILGDTPPSPAPGGNHAEEVFAEAEMIVKVKEPQAVERAMLREGQVLFTYLHLAPDPEQTRDLLQSGVTPSPMKR
jgi:hypothetical protein